MDWYALSVRLILFFSMTILTLGNFVPLEFEQGTNVSLNFNFEYEELSTIQLKRNGVEIFRKFRMQVETTRDKSISMSYDLDVDKVTFNLRDVDILDSGEYTCYVIGRKKPPTYSVKVISSTRDIGISKIFDSTVLYSFNDTVSVIEGESLALVCRSTGGLRSECDIKWYIESSGQPINYRQNITQCSNYHEESSLEIDVVSVNLNESRILCTSGGIHTSIFVRIKRKPYIVCSEDMFAESSRNEIFCVLNDTSEHPTFHWSLQDTDVTQNATQQPIEIMDGRYVWMSTLSLYSDRRHFEKLLKCKISNDDSRSDTLTLKIKFGASITNIFSTPSQHVDIYSSVNITCVGTGYPALQFLWLKGCEGGDYRNVPEEPLFNHLNETMFASTISFTTVTKADEGCYKCSAYNGIGEVAEKDVTIQLEEMGIIITDGINFKEGHVVNLLCVVKKKQMTYFIRWTIDHKIDISSNATQDEFLDHRGQTLLRSTLTFHPKRRYHGTDLSCQWGRDEMYSDTIVLNISYAAKQEKNISFFHERITESIIFIAVVISVLVIIAAVLFVVCRRQRVNRNMFHPKPPDTIGIQTLGKINAGVMLPSVRSSPVLYEVMKGYTTQVSPFSDCSVEDSRGLQDFIRDGTSDVTYLSRCSVTSSTNGNYQTSIGDKLKTLFGEDFDIETQERGNRLSKHFVIGGDNYPIFEEDEDLSSETYSITNLKSDTDTNFTLNLTIHNKLTQRGSIFFCDATLTKKMTKMNVTVKILSEFARREEKILFKKEINIVKNLDSHPNIAEVLGTCCSSRPNCIILEKILETNLKSLLLENDTEELTETAEILRKYAEQVCSGMTFLSKNKCYHPNLRCAKVTVDKERICKLYDFVPADILSAQDDREQEQQDILQIGLLAPEIMQGKEHTVHTDVWGFGILLWEIYYYGSNQFERGTENKIYGHPTSPDCLKRPESCPQDVYKLMLSCLCEDPSDRPTFPALLDNIKMMDYQTVTVVSTAV